MENILLVTSIIIIAFGILQIILFFKVWGMTNDVRDIKQKLEKTEQSTPDYKFYMLSGENVKAYILIRDMLVKELVDMASRYNEENFIKVGNNIISKYSGQLKETGHPIPDFLLSAEKFIEYRKHIDSLQ